MVIIDCHNDNNTYTKLQTHNQSVVYRVPDSSKMANGTEEKHTNNTAMSFARLRTSLKKKTTASNLIKF